MIQWVFLFNSALLSSVWRKQCRDKKSQLARRAVLLSAAELPTSLVRLACWCARDARWVLRLGVGAGRKLYETSRGGSHGLCSWPRGLDLESGAWRTQICNMQWHYQNILASPPSAELTHALNTARGGDHIYIYIYIYTYIYINIYI